MFDISSVSQPPSAATSDEDEDDESSGDQGPPLYERFSRLDVYENRSVRTLSGGQAFVKSTEQLKEEITRASLPPLSDEASGPNIWAPHPVRCMPL
jgi:hypothetical protein